MHNTQITENRPSLWMRPFFSLCVSFMAHEVKMKDWSAEFIHRVHLWPEGRVSKSSRRRWKELPVRLTLSGRSGGKREDWPVVILKLPELVSVVLSHWQPRLIPFDFIQCLVYSQYKIESWDLLMYSHTHTDAVWTRAMTLWGYSLSSQPSQWIISCISCNLPCYSTLLVVMYSVVNK